MSTSFIYTIGHQERQRPDLLITPMGEKNEVVSPEEANRRMMAAGNLINYLVDNWETNPIKAGDTAEDALGRHYKIVDDKRADKKEVFKQYTIQASNYYGHDNYSVLVLLPCPPCSDGC
jgi:hypothetical protein